MSDRGALVARARRLTRSSSYDGPTLASLAVLVGVLLLNLLQQPGRITFDTKLDLQLAPSEFLSRSLSLWNPDSALGGLQNQASGYLFPMGPAFVLGDQLGVPVWVWERLWSALVMLLAYEGARRLARSWPGVGAWGAVVAGLTYMAAPRVLTTVGALSGETLPGAVLPWTVLPLVLYLRGTWRRAPALVLSAVSVLFMGGQNATLVVACLILPGLLLLASAGRPVRRVATDLVAWSLLVLAATLWWLVPLVLLGSYAPPFLDFIESARTAAGRTGWLTSLRGTDHWVAYFSDGGPSGWLGGWQLATSSALLVTTTLVALLGLIGLARGRLAFRLPLLLSLLVGLAFLTLGSGGWAGSLLSGPWLDALDTWLAPLRNVHKFDPLVRLPLSLGVGAFVTTMVPLLATRTATRLTRVDERRAATGFVAATALLVLAAAQPAVAGHLRSEDGFEALPDEWQEAVEYLETVPGPVGVLVLPGSGFAVQEWGRTVDEPIQVLGGPPWAGRAQVTVAPAGTLRVLDALERRLAEGRPVPNVAEVLRRLGITHLLVRGDLDPDGSDAPPVEVVRAGLSGDLDLAPVAAFGTGTTSAPRLEIYRVDGDEDRRVALQRWDERIAVDGAPESVVDLVGAGVLGPDQAMTVVTDDPADPDVLTDGNRRVERSFGRVHGALSGVMAAEDEFRLTRPKHDYVGDEVPDEQTLAEYDDLVQVVASSSAGYADTFGRVHPEEHPYAAVDASPFTSWGSEPYAESEGQWLELRFPEPRELGAVTAQLDITNGARVRSVELVTDTGSRTVEVGPEGAVTSTPPPEGATSRLRIVIGEVTGQRRQVRLSDLRVDGLETGRTLRLPGTLGREGMLHLRAETPQRACFGVAPTVTCSAGRQVETPESLGFSRTFEVGESGTWEVRGWAVATHGPTLAALLEPLGGERVRVEASSTFGGDPAVAPVHVHDGEEGTSWYAAESDRAPVLDLSWAQPRRIRSVLASLTPGAPGRLPDAFVVDPVVRGEEPQLVTLTGPDAGEMEPVRTTRLRLTAVVEDVDGDVDGDAETDGIGVSELDIAGLEDLRHRPAPAAETGVLCGFGPTVTVAGQRIRLGVSGTVQDVVDGSRLALTSCGRSRVELAEGEHRLEVRNEAGFSVSDLVIRPRAGEDLGAIAGGIGDAEVRTWGPVRRSVEVRAAKDAVLTVPESYNVGWEATLDGTGLDPVRVDGWKQGWVVPQGSAGLVLLSYTPQESFSMGLGAGAGLAAVLVLAAGLLWRRRATPARTSASVRAQRRTTSSRAALVGRVAAAVAVLALAFVSVPLAVGAVLGVASGRFETATRQRVLVAGVALLPLAAAMTLVVGSPLSPSTAADALAALAVGLAVGLAVRTEGFERAAAESGTAGTT